MIAARGTLAKPEPAKISNFVDMTAVAAAALQGKQPMHRWHLEFDCHGAPFVWDGAADSEGEAIALGLLAIYMDGRFDETARVAICVQRSA